MAIRYECEQCGSVLKINEERAGKPGKCPKCKTAFTVPQPDEFPDDSVDLSEPENEEDAVPPPPKKSTSSPYNFDVDDFLSNDPGLEPTSKSKGSKKPKPSVADIDEDELLSDEPPAVAPKSNRKPSSKTVSNEEDDENAFQIRRSESKASSPKKPASVDLDDEDDGKTSSNSSRRPPTASSTATSSNMASELLAKSGKKGKKSAWSEMAEDAKQESEYDYTDLKNQLKKAVPLVLGGIVLCYVLYKTVFSAMGGKAYLPPLGQVTGTVTLNGKPVENAMVWFHPIQPSADKGDKKKRVSSSGGATDATGHYELRYVGEATGAVVGECRIGIEAPSRSDIPPKYLGANLTVTKTVTSGTQVIDLNLSQ